MAIDHYSRLVDNIAALAATIEGMRAIQRHGGAEILDRAFTGFAALPAPPVQDQPHEILGVAENATEGEIQYAWRRLASQHHPDNGGNTDEMARINAARDALLAARGARA
jgi:DnaJ-domain-containing protein 1